MRAGVFARGVVLGAACLAWCAAARADSYHLIVCGSGGESEYSDKFLAWGSRLRDVLVNDLHHAAARVRLMTEDGRGPEAEKTSLDAVKRALELAASSVRPEDDLCLYLIGHGSYLQKLSKFQIPGPDLTAAELRTLIEPIKVKRFVLLNASSSSAGFVNELSGAGRVICAATRSTEQKNATEFMEYFVRCLEEGSADQNRDERVSFLEACDQAAAMTSAWFLSEGLVETEKAILDDTGDGLGSALPIGRSGEAETVGVESEGETQPDASLDGAVAALCFIKDFTFPEAAPRELVDAYLAKLAGVEELKRKKKEMNAAEYYMELEKLLLSAARDNREIRRLSTPQP